MTITSRSDHDASPPEDGRRRRSLAALELLGPDPMPAYDALVALVAEACDAERAGMTLVAGGQAWLKAGVGTDDLEVSRHDPLCARVVDSGEPVVVTAPHADLGGDGVALGAPVRDPEGLVVGVVWVAWRSVREVSDRLVQVVSAFAHQATRVLAQRRRKLELARLTQRRNRELREEAAARRVLRDIASGRPLGTTLVTLAAELEQLLPGSRCCVMLRDGEMLRLGAAPSLPAEVHAAFDGTVIGPDAPAGGKAAATGRQVVEAELAAEPTWASLRTLLARHRLRASFSAPIAAADDRGVLGTLTVYRDRPSTPHHEELATVERMVELAAVAIEHDTHRREVERRARVLDEVSDAVVVCDPRTLRVRWVNGAAVTLTGMRRADLEGRRLDEVAVLGDAQVRRAAAAIVDGEVDRRTVEVSSVRPDGATVRAELEVQVIEDELVLVARDLADRDAYDAALRRREARYRELAERSSEGIYRVRLVPEVRYEYANAAFAALCGTTPQQVLADASYVLARIHPDDRPAELAARRGALPEEVSSRDVRFVADDGTVRTVLLSELSIVDRAGRTVALQGVAVDVTDRQRTQAALQAALEQQRRVSQRLREVDAIKDSFLQAVSHELRTPLTAIVGFSTTLRDHGERLEPARRSLLLDRLSRNAERLAAVLTDLLDLDRLAAGQGLAERRPADVAPLLERAVAEIDLGARTLRLVLEPCVVPVDVPKVERVLVNLLDNAAKHTPPGTEVVAEVRRAEAGCEIVVRDDGPGLHPELGEAVFEPFRQGPESSRDPSPGTGIGLAVVARVAQLHGGRASAESPPEGGAMFRVWLPG